jgi:hypothetical protein
MPKELKHLPLLCLVALSLIVAFSVERLNAQILYGSLVGTVTDPSGAVIPNATVTITNDATGQTREVSSDEAGRYSIPNISPGAYTLKVAIAGFRTYEQKNLVITINTVTRTDVNMTVGEITQQVMVEAAAALLQTDKADVHTEFASKAVADLPLPAYRNYQSLLNLVPGATPTYFQNAQVDTPGRSLSTNINGTARNNNNTRVDGAANVYIWLPHHTLYNPPVEAVETVNVSTTSFDADQGMTGGAAITVTTKSGTNDMHGTAFWYHDDNALKARPYFWYKDKPLSINNIAGGTIGGPIKKNKLFYFTSFERTMQRTGNTARYSVPPADIRTGDFSKYAAYSTIYDPLTGNADGSGRTPFANNKIPASRISTIFDSIQKLCPLPNRGGLSDDIWGLSGNYDVSNVVKMDRDNWDVKTNWAANSKLNIWGKYSRMGAIVNGPAPFGELGGPALGTRGTGDTTVQIPIFGYNYIFSPTFLLDGNFSYTRFDQTVRGPDFGKFWGSEVWKIPGTNGGTQYANDPMYSGLPNFNQGFTNWGNNDTWMPVNRNDRSYLFNTNFSKIKGAHQIRFGYDTIRHALNHWQPETANPRGDITFGGNATMIKGGTSRSINQYASALLGIVTSYSKSVQYFLMKTREWQHAFFISDRWQVTRKLTLSLGMRYEYYPLVNRDDRGLERWDPATNTVYMGGVGSVPWDNGITVSKKLFAPRVGLAYRIGEKTVVRSGYGISYDPIPFGRPLRGQYPATITGRWDALESYGYYNTLDKGIPAMPLPDVSKGILTLPPTVDMGLFSPWGGQIHRGYIQSWNLTVERRLPLDLVSSVAYVGTQTVHQLGYIDINAGPIGKGNAGRPLYATQGRSIAAYMWDGFASGDYHAMQATLDRRFTKGFMLKSSYTWSKTINMFDDTGWSGVRWTNWVPDLRRNRTVAGYDRTHMFTMGWIYELPVGAGKQFNVSGPANVLLGGWKINGIFSAYSGLPFTVSASSSSINMPSTSQGANLIAPVRMVGDKGPGSWYYDPTSFGDPNFNRPADVYRFGTMGPNSLRGPGFWRADVSMFKEFKILERLKMEFKLEAFNLTNTPRFGNPAGNVSSMNFNTDGSIKAVNNFMAITSASDERQIRFGFRFAF